VLACVAFWIVAFFFQGDILPSQPPHASKSHVLKTLYYVIRDFSMVWRLFKDVAFK
jgi:hypothetical protein